MIPAGILGTGSFTPGRKVTTAEVGAAAYPGRDPEDLIARTGIRTRFLHGPEDSVASVATRCLEIALEDAGIQAEQLARIILVNSHGTDTICPATANIVAADLGLRGSVDCFDLNNACTGFVTGIDLAARCVSTGMGPIAVVSAELFSRHTVPENPRPYVIFGDAGAAVILGRAKDGTSGVLGSAFGNDGVLRHSVTLDHSEQNPPLVQFGKSNSRITFEALTGLQRSSTAAMAAADVTLDDIRWVLMHQGNGVMFRLAAERMKIDPSKLIDVVQEFGSVGSASVALCLDKVWRGGLVEPGDRILLCAVGSGLSYGAVVFRV